MSEDEQFYVVILIVYIVQQNYILRNRRKHRRYLGYVTNIYVYYFITLLIE